MQLGLTQPGRPGELELAMCTPPVAAGGAMGRIRGHGVGVLGRATAPQSPTWGGWQGDMAGEVATP